MLKRNLKEFIAIAENFKYPKIKLNLYEKYLLRKIQLKILRDIETRYPICSNVLNAGEYGVGFRDNLVNKVLNSLGFQNSYLEEYLRTTYQIVSGRYLSRNEARMIRIYWIKQLTNLPVNWKEFSIE